MQPTQYTEWHTAERISPEADQALLDYPVFMRQILYNRGIATAKAAADFLECTPRPDWDPFRMLGMQPAVERIGQAIAHGEWIAVYGDYDVDGVSATALMIEVLTSLGAQARAYIPNRFDEGYGLNIEALDTLQKEGVSLVITVDCGIRSIDEAQHAAQIGLDLIITDHHHCAAEIPAALAVINPRQPGDEYPEKELAGVGLAYKLTQALLAQLPNPTGVQAEEWLDLVALGSVADLAPLVGETRVLVRSGIHRMRQSRRQGLVSLAKISGLTLSRLSATDIGFMLGPRLNAAGRLESALTAYQLLVEKDYQACGLLAQQLDNQNRSRQSQTRDMQQRVEAILQDSDGDLPLIYAADPDFNQGVVGLAASRIAETYYRPAIIASPSDEFTRASCRSIPGFHITDALDQCADLLIRHGGHAAAAGFTVRNENVAPLIQRMTQIAAQQLGDLSRLHKTLEADLDLPLAELNYAMHKDLEKIQPCGYGNSEPVFISRNVEVRGKWVVGKDRQHLKLKLAAGRTLINAIAFRFGYLEKDLPNRVDVLYTYELNEYNGQVEPQLNIRDIKLAG